jgi:hypothetical protein
MKINELFQGGKSGSRWYSDDEMISIVGRHWRWDDDDNETLLDKEEQIADAQDWLDKQGYSVSVLDLAHVGKENYWKISGIFIKNVNEKWDDSGASDANGRWAKYRDGEIGVGAMATWLYNSRVHKKTKAEKLRSAYGAIAQQENTSKLISSSKADSLRAALKKKYGD